MLIKKNITIIVKELHKHYMPFFRHPSQFIKENMFYVKDIFPERLMSIII